MASLYERRCALAVFREFCDFLFQLGYVTDRCNRTSSRQPRQESIFTTQPTSIRRKLRKWRPRFFGFVVTDVRLLWQIERGLAACMGACALGNKDEPTSTGDLRRLRITFSAR